MKKQIFNFVKSKAFTLAETLIVIGIIGVVAALTLPNLNHATGDKEKVTRVKKIYSALTDAFDRAQVIYGPCDEWSKGIEDDKKARAERFAKRITEFMKVSKDCGFDDGCYSKAPLLRIDGSEYDSNYLESLKKLNAYMVILSDGVSLRFNTGGHSSYKIGVDIDGPNKGKNQDGVDVFDFSVFDSNDAEVTEYGAKINQLYPSFSPRFFSGDFVGPYGYVQWILENGNLDYIKEKYKNSIFICPDGEPLNWETKTSCN